MLLFVWFVKSAAKVQFFLGDKGVKELKGVKEGDFYFFYLFTFLPFYFYS